MRANAGMKITPIAKVTLPTLGPRLETSAMARMMPGKQSSTVIVPMISRSGQRPK